MKSISVREWVASASCKFSSTTLTYMLTILRHSYSLNDNGTDKEVLWSKSDFLKIMDSFRLPKRFVQMIARSHCCFTEYYSGEDIEEPERYCKDVVQQSNVGL